MSTLISLSPGRVKLRCSPIGSESVDDAHQTRLQGATPCGGFTEAESKDSLILRDCGEGIPNDQRTKDQPKEEYDTRAEFFTARKGLDILIIVLLVLIITTRSLERLNRASTISSAGIAHGVQSNQKCGISSGTE
eukprot:GHVH01007841.1.p1 GENE.GHVH01007841.1~~GHVH01007841.1.p1  ORF type:complete len:135 (-),score=16.58 GHVH01007841.1:115-519(-)